MEKEKHIKTNKPMPESIRKALEDKRAWKESVRNGAYSAAMDKVLNPVK
jgi:hypothetical protein